jgi:hypothetical protein
VGILYFVNTNVAPILALFAPHPPVGGSDCSSVDSSVFQPGLETVDRGVRPVLRRDQEQGLDGSRRGRGTDFWSRVPETRDARREPRSDLGRRGALRLGAGWTDCSAFSLGVYFFPFPFPFSFFIIKSNEHFESGSN